MKIGILGAPGSGKSDFALKLRAELMLDRPKGSVYVLDNYVADLRIRTRLEYGQFGNFVDDLQVVFKRREWELSWSPSDTITVGTVLDSVVHNFVRAEEDAQTRHEVGLSQERLKAIAATFGLLYTDTWDYDYAFLLRSDDIHGKALVDLIATYRSPVLSFKPEVPDDKKASTAAAAIRALEEERLPPVVERRVRSGGEISEAIGGPSEPMPDVPEQGRDSDDA